MAAWRSSSRVGRWRHAGVGLCLAWCAAAGAAAPTAAVVDDVSTDAAVTWSCVELGDVSARRTLQREPCRLPLVPAPVARDAEAASPRWPSYPAKSTDRDGAHPMFWRFPVQPVGPHDVPRHSRR